MKKLLALVLALTLACSLSACTEADRVNANINRRTTSMLPADCR